MRSPKNVCFVYIKTKYFVALKPCRVNHFLRFYGNTHRFYIVNSFIEINNTKGKHCCLSMATMIT